MEIDAVIGSPVKQTLPFVDNYIGAIYGQDCGNYEVTLKTPTSFPLFRFQKQAPHMTRKEEVTMMKEF